MPRDDSIAAPPPLLTRETIDAQVAERVRWRKAEMTARAKGEELDRWFAGLRVVLGEETWRAYVPSDFLAGNAAVEQLPLPPAAPVEAAPCVPIAQGNTTLASWVRSVLASSDKGLTFEAILEASRRTLGVDGPHQNPSELLRFLEVSANRGRVRKKGSLYFSADPELQTGNERRRTRTADLKAILKSALESIGGRGTARDLIRGTAENPLMVDLLKKSRQYPYSLLSRMVIEGDLQKDGHDYVLPGTDSHQSESSSVGQPPLQQSKEA